MGVDIHPRHLCSVCGAAYDHHATSDNPVTPFACPVGTFPRWAKSDDRDNGARFDQRVERFWRASKTTFKPR